MIVVIIFILCSRSFFALSVVQISVILKMKLERAEMEEKMYSESKKWFMEEVIEKDNKIAQIRIEMVINEVYRNIIGVLWSCGGQGYCRVTVE